jgi:hypothetical protein
MPYLVPADVIVCCFVFFFMEQSDDDPDDQYNRQKFHVIPPFIFGHKKARSLLATGLQEGMAIPYLFNFGRC